MSSIILPPTNAPANPSEGELYYDNTAKQVKFRDNAGFKALGTEQLRMKTQNNDNKLRNLIPLVIVFKNLKLLKFILNIILLI